MMFKLLQQMAALFAVGFIWGTVPASAQTQTAAPLVPKAQEIARAERRASKPMVKMVSNGEKKKSKAFSYSNLLPFGVGQFEQDKTVLGTTLATAQAGFLLMYFERMNAVRSSNADAADVMRGADFAAARNDPTIISFLDQNEAYTLKAQQQANMALLGFFALYTAGVVEAVFDPLSRFGLGSTKKKKRDTADKSEGVTTDGSSRLVQDLREEEKSSKVGVFYQPAPGSASAVGVSLQKPL